MSKKSKYTNMQKLVDECTTAKRRPVPMEVLQAAYADAPPAAKCFLDNRAQEVLMVDMSILQHVAEKGVIMPVEDITTLESTYNFAIKFTAKVNPEALKTVSKTAQDVGHRIAAELDAGIKRVLLEDKHANRMALINLSTCHAKVVRCMADITLTAEELEEADAGADTT
ncbi:hypothetical protein LCGC14_2950560 [marine sediment metagenome]|uniref:Uncharacterized protein n=1 Tax=marine sediment metagenome TaxID=412755 RepID=A0A0F8XF38_9ZZZZ